MPDIQQRNTPMTRLEANKYVANDIGKIRLPTEVSIPENITLEKFVTLFITDLNTKWPTIHASNGSQQTKKNARRTLGDITRIAQFYLPNEKVCVEKVKNVLKELLKSQEISTAICKQIYKRVFHKRVPGPQTITELDVRDEFGWKYNLEKKTPVLKKFS